MCLRRREPGAVQNSVTERTKAPNGARFDSPGRSRPCRRSPGLRERRIEKAQRAEIPSVRGISPRWGFCCFIFVNPGLRFAAPWAIESRPLRGSASGQRSRAQPRPNSNPWLNCARYLVSYPAAAPCAETLFRAPRSSIPFPLQPLQCLAYMIAGDAWLLDTNVAVGKADHLFSALSLGHPCAARFLDDFVKQRIHDLVSDAETLPNSGGRHRLRSLFVIRASSFIRHSDFVIRHFQPRRPHSGRLGRSA